MRNKNNTETNGRKTEIAAGIELAIMHRANKLTQGTAKLSILLTYYQKQVYKDSVFEKIYFLVREMYAASVRRL